MSLASHILTETKTIEAITPSTKWLTDNDDNTCNPPSFVGKSISVVLEKSTELTWMRLILQKNSSKHLGIHKLQFLLYEYRKAKRENVK